MRLSDAVRDLGETLAEFSGPSDPVEIDATRFRGLVKAFGEIADEVQALEAERDAACRGDDDYRAPRRLAPGRVARSLR